MRIVLMRWRILRAVMVTIALTMPDRIRARRSDPGVECQRSGAASRAAGSGRGICAIAKCGRGLFGHGICYHADEAFGDGTGGGERLPVERECLVERDH